MKDSLIYREGFWNTRKDEYPLFPFPFGHSDPWKGKKKFLLALISLEEKAQIRRFKGFSRCRICDKSVGTVTYTFKNWEWPEGFKHYVRVHNVRPSFAFQQFVLYTAGITINEEGQYE